MKDIYNGYNITVEDISCEEKYSRRKRKCKMPKQERWYGIEKGRETGVTNNWEMAKAQVDKYSENSYKRFDSPSEAKQFAEGNHERSQGDSKYYGGASDNQKKN